MPTRLPQAVLSPVVALVPLVAVLLLAVGCGGTGSVTMTVVCTPACPAGQTCTAQGCVAGDLGVADLAVPLLDLAGLCGTQTCSAPTPFCMGGSTCVQCLADTDCPMGHICKSVGNVTACLPGCKDDARCAGLKGDGGAGSLCCNGFCTDVSADPSNCGACGMACMSTNAASACQGGACAAGACRPGWGDCNANPLDGCETNLHTDAKNCKACGMACTYANGIGGCSDGCYLAGCQFGFDDCNSDPSDGCETSTISDKKNCGSCGTACGAKPHASISCVNANCQLTQCDNGWSDCDGNPANGCETNTGVDLNNCGRCGNVCGNNQVCKNSGCTCQACNIPNATTKCVNNVCVFDKCLPGFGDCNFNLADGCEIDLTSDANNCGACNMACPKAKPVCLMSACSDQICNGIGYNACPSGAMQWCDVMPADKTNQAQAKIACEACYGMPCTLQNGDCAGPGYCIPNVGGQQPCWGWQAGCSGGAGRVWQYGSSFTTYGNWAM